MRNPFRLRSRTPLGLVLLSGVLASACGPRRAAVIAPVQDPQAAATELEGRTSLVEPLRIIFAWQLNEAGVRVNGRGVARIEPPYRARLDLFLGNGETVISAALVNGELRLPPGAPDNILPPQDLMWGTLGVFRPEAGTELIGGDRLEGQGLQLRYRHEDGHELHYFLAAGVLRSLELLEGGYVVQRVEVAEEQEGRYPSEATYRNLAAFRELKITRESLDVVSPYPSDIWSPLGWTAG